MNNFSIHPTVQACLKERNARLARFWMSDPFERMQVEPDLLGVRALVIDAEDAFTAMLTQQLSAIGLDVTRSRFDEDRLYKDDWDLVLMGPGPGDPRNLLDPRISRIQQGLRHLLAHQRPFLAVCLSHQVLSLELGLPLMRLPTPNQGLQREIDLFGRRERVGFYNTFVAQSDADDFLSRGSGPVTVCRDQTTREVYALRGAHFVSFQFHAESLLTANGVEIIASHLSRMVHG